MRLPGTQRAAGWATRTFQLNDSDIAGIRRGWRHLKASIAGVITDLAVTGGQLLTDLRTFFIVTVLPAIIPAIGKRQRAREYEASSSSDGGDGG